MNRSHAPTVRQLPPLRHLVAGALAVGAVTVAAPAVADAAVSTCSYSPATKTLVVNDHSGAEKFRLVRVGDQIRIADGNAGTNFCPVPGQFDVASVNNTDKIQIFRDGDSVGGGVELDMTQGLFAPGATPESDGSSEIEIAITDASNSDIFTNQLSVLASSGNDVVVANMNGSLNFGNDFDLPDVTSSLAPFAVRVHGGPGADRIRGAGLPRQGNVVLFGDEGNDTLTGGVENDRLLGGAGDDRLASVDGFGESIDGDDFLFPEIKGNDFATVDDEDSVSNVETKSIEVHGVGKLKLKQSLRAVAGEKTRVAIAWKHPKAWKALRSLEWRLMDGVDRVGTVRIHPRSGRVVAKGVVKIGAAHVSHKGTTVTAKLALRLAKRLVGAPLTVDVAATDSTGRTQVEPAAGLIDVTG